MPLTVEDIMEAAKLMKGYSLDYEDAIHLATVLRSRAKEIISNDEDFEREAYKHMRSSVERFFAWLRGGFRRLILRWERLTSTSLGFIQIACIMIYWRVLK